MIQKGSRHSHKTPALVSTSYEICQAFKRKLTFEDIHGWELKLDFFVLQTLGFDDNKKDLRRKSDQYCFPTQGSSYVRHPFCLPLTWQVPKCITLLLCMSRDMIFWNEFQKTDIVFGEIFWRIKVGEHALRWWWCRQCDAGGCHVIIAKATSFIIFLILRVLNGLWGSFGLRALIPQDRVARYLEVMVSTLFHVSSYWTNWNASAF